ncbi:unnamed protein product [Cylicocyclus nassatus]|uniref:Uncharacterized protein n=1 Tax=Cylicocyclus nassatus TaxID=53992 RepID=A0AA36DMS9_CYLNA|nr:unnamed protein product [Cylicocyclus nassatus]
MLFEIFAFYLYFIRVPILAAPPPTTRSDDPRLKSELDKINECFGHGEFDVKWNVYVLKLALALKFCCDCGEPLKDVIGAKWPTGVGDLYLAVTVNEGIFHTLAIEEGRSEREQAIRSKIYTVRSQFHILTEIAFAFTGFL